jgi:hypothetical protein
MAVSPTVNRTIAVIKEKNSGSHLARRTRLPVPDYRRYSNEVIISMTGEESASYFIDLRRNRNNRGCFSTCQFVCSRPNALTTFIPENIC